MLTVALPPPLCLSDEGQFFPDIVHFSDYWASRGKVVIVAALDATFERKPFMSILDLIPLAEQVIKLTAVCMLCHRDASFTKRIGSETAVEVIGGADKYLSTCRACFALEAQKPASPPRAAEQEAVDSTAAAAADAGDEEQLCDSAPASPLQGSDSGVMCAASPFSKRVGAVGGAAMLVAEAELQHQSPHKKLLLHAKRKAHTDDESSSKRQALSLPGNKENLLSV